MITPDVDDIPYVSERVRIEQEELDEEFELQHEEPPPAEDEVEVEDLGRFDRFSLSNALESLMDHSLLKVIQLRLEYGLGWAGAECMFSETERSQLSASDVYKYHAKVRLGEDSMFLMI